LPLSTCPHQWPVGIMRLMLEKDTTIEAQRHDIEALRREMEAVKRASSGLAGSEAQAAMHATP